MQSNVPLSTEDCNTHYRGASGYQEAPPQEGGSPGFFTGALGGAVLGYLFGSRGQSGTYNPAYYSPDYGSSSYCDPPTQRVYPDLDCRDSTSSSSSDGGTRTASGEDWASGFQGYDIH